MTFFIVFLVFVSDKPLTRGSFFSLLLVYHNQKHISMQKEKSLRPTAGRFGMASACALAMFSGKNIYNFAILENLRIFQNCLFTGGIGNELPQSKPTGFDSSLPEGAFGMAALFPAEAQSLRTCPLPLGGAVAQRLRGYRWRSEKSVKAIAPTGAALAFLCFDFFFRIVKGV